MKPITRLTLALALVGGIAGCSDSSSNPSSGPQMSFNLATRAAGAAPAPGITLAPPDTIIQGSDELVINKVEVVLREIEFERENDDSCDDLAVNHDACEEVKAGPVLLDLPLGVGAQHKFTVSVDTGTFDQLKFEVHKPEDSGDAADQAFLAAHPDFAGISIRVTGTWNGAPFTYTSDLDASQEGELSPPLVVTETTAAEVTLKVDVGSWFQNGGALTDPATAGAGGPNESVVSNNIKSSFEVFEDEDHDGEHD